MSFLRKETIFLIIRLTIFLRFSFVSGGIVLAALDLKWKDGMLASMLMCIMSTVICLIMTVWSWKMWRNDDEKPKVCQRFLHPGKVLFRKRECS